MFEKRVYVGVGLDADGILSALKQRGKKSLQGSLLADVARALMASTKDDRVEVFEVNVESVHVDDQFPHQVQVQFVISWSLYHGCEDRNEADDEYASEGATYSEDGYLIFQVQEPCRPPSDC